MMVATAAAVKHLPLVIPLEGRSSSTPVKQRGQGSAITRRCSAAFVEAEAQQLRTKGSIQRCVANQEALEAVKYVPTRSGYDTGPGDRRLTRVKVRLLNVADLKCRERTLAGMPLH